MTTKSLFKKFTAILSFVLLLQFISPTAAQAVEPNTLSGFVYSSDPGDDSVPVPGVWINGGGTSVQSRSDGSFSLTTTTSGNVPFNLSPNSAGVRYFQANATVSISAGANTQNFHLDPYPVGPNTLNGTLQNIEGAPISGASISLSMQNPYLYFNATSSYASGAQGDFSFSSLPDGDYQAWIYASGYYSRNITVTLPAAQGTNVWQLVPRATHTISGDVESDADSSIKYSGASVSGCVSVFGQRVCDSQNADNLGHYSLTLPAGLVTITANPGWSFNSPKFFQTTTTVQMGNENITFAAKVKPWATGTNNLTGTLVTSSSTNPVPVANTQIYLYLNNAGIYSQNYSLTTTSLGEFDFQGLPDGTYSVNIYGNSIYGKNFSVTLPLGSTAPLQWTAVAKTSTTLSGHVQSENDSTVKLGFAQISACVAVSGQNICNWTTADADGFYSVELPEGHVTLNVYPSGSGDKFYYKNTTAEMADQDTTKDIDVKPYPVGNLEISGMVVDDSDPGTPLSGVQVYINGPNGVSYSKATGIDGTFRFPKLFNGSYEFYAYDYRYNQPQARKSVALSSVSKSGVKITLQRKGNATITGKLVSSDGVTPVPNFTIYAQQLGKYSSSTRAQSGSDGTYTLTGLSANTKYELYSWANQSMRLLKPTRVTALSGSTGINVVMKPYRSGQSRISGTVVGPNGAAVANQNVSMSLNTYGGDDESNQNYSTQTDSNGHYTFENLPSGEGSVSTYSGGFTSCSTYVRMTGSNSKSFDCKMLALGATLNIQYETSTGHFLKTTDSYINWSSSESPFASVWMNPSIETDGTMTYSGVPKSEFSKFEYQLGENNSSTEYVANDWSNKSFTLDTRGASVSKKIVIPSLGSGSNSVTGTVKNSSGVRLEGVKLNWSSYISTGYESASMAGEVITDQNGNYKIENLKAGSSISVNFNPGSQTIGALSSESGAIETSLNGTVPANPVTRVRNLTIEYGAAEGAAAGGNIEGGTYTVRVVDEANQPLSGITASISGLTYQQATSDMDGMVTFSGLPVGYYDFWVDSNATNVSQNSWRGFSITSGHMDIEDSNDVIMNAAPVGVSSATGTIFNATSNSNEIAYECRLVLNHLTNSNIRDYWLQPNCDVDSNGVWSAGGLPAGEYTLQFGAVGSSFGEESVALDRQYAFPAPQIITVDGINALDVGSKQLITYSNETTSNVVVSLFDAGTRAPLTDKVSCGLSSTAISGVSNQSLDTELTGKATFNNLIPGLTYHLNCYLYNKPGDASANLVAREGSSTAKLYFDLKNNDAKITGTVTNESGPVEGIRVSTQAFTEGAPRCDCGGGYSYKEDYTDADGKFYIDDAPTGTVVISVFDPTGKDSKFRKVVNLQSGSNPEINAALTRGITVSGLIEKANGKAISGNVSLVLEPVDPSGSEYYGNNTANETKYQFQEAVGTGIYRLQLRSMDSTTENYSSGYLQLDGSIGLDKSTARQITIDPSISTTYQIPRIEVSKGGRISGQVLFQTNDGTNITSGWLGGEVRLWTKDGSTWTKSSLTGGWFGNYNNGYFNIDGLAPGEYKLELTDQWLGAFESSFATKNGSDIITVVAEQTTTAVAGVMKYKRPDQDASYLSLTSIDEAQQIILRDSVEVVQDGTSVLVKAPDDMAGQYVSVSSATVASASSAGIRAATVPVRSDWLQVRADGFVAIPSNFVRTTRSTIVIGNFKNVPVGIADLAGVAAVTPTPPVVTPTPPVVTPTPPVVTPTPPQLVTQTPGTSVPSTFKPGKKLVLKVKTNQGSAVKVTAKGCKVSPTYKTTISYKTKKVGKRTVRTKVTTKTLISYSVTMGKKGSTCTVTQTSPATTTLAAMTSVTAIKVK